MDKNEFTKKLYGEGQFRYSIDKGIPEGFIDYHKKNFQKYFCLSEKEFSGKRILETGSGSGKHAVVLAMMQRERERENVIAYDLSEINIARGTKLKEQYNLSNLRFEQRNLMYPLTENEPYDLISAHNWMQHAENPSVVFKNLAEKLKVGGRIYLSLYHAGTFRFFISQIARFLLGKEHYEMTQRLVMFHFPTGFREFNNPDDIRMEGLFDDFFVPYCHSTTYDVVVHDADILGLKPITDIPQSKDLRAVDNIPLRIGFEKTGGMGRQADLKFNRAVDEFQDQSHPLVSESIRIAKELIDQLHTKNDLHEISAFCLGLYRLRGLTSRSNTYEKYELLQKYMKMVLENSLRNISNFYDTQLLYEVKATS